MAETQPTKAEREAAASRVMRPNPGMWPEGIEPEHLPDDHARMAPGFDYMNDQHDTGEDDSK